MSIDLISSRSNESVKQIRKLRDRKYRDSTGKAYVEGIRQVIEAIEQEVRIERIILTDSFLSDNQNNKLAALIHESNVVKMVVTEDVFRSFSVKEGPKGVAAIIYQEWHTLEEYQNFPTGVWVCLWEIADPGNLGTIIRTMDAVKSKGLILAGNCTDPYDPSAIRASMGGIFSQTLVSTTLEELVNVIRKKSLNIYGASDSAKDYYRNIDYPSDMLLLMGSERQGIPDELKEFCTAMVSIPMRGVCDSLNLAVATGILLYEILDQHSMSTGS